MLIHLRFEGFFKHCLWPLLGNIRSFLVEVDRCLSRSLPCSCRGKYLLHVICVFVIVFCLLLVSWLISWYVMTFGFILCHATWVLFRAFSGDFSLFSDQVLRLFLGSQSRDILKADKMMQQNTTSLHTKKRKNKHSAWQSMTKPFTHTDDNNPFERKHQVNCTPVYTPKRPNQTTSIPMSPKKKKKGIRSTPWPPPPAPSRFFSASATICPGCCLVLEVPLQRAVFLGTTKSFRCLVDATTWCHFSFRIWFPNPKGPSTSWEGVENP